jgi:FAD/FMN-containing dehydrogenase
VRKGCRLPTVTGGLELHPMSAGGGYVNVMMEDEGEARIRASYGDNYERLTRVKKRYDPENLFHINQNIPPAS